MLNLNTKIRFLIDTYDPFWFMNRFLTFLLAALCVLVAVAKEEVINPSELDFESNLILPAVPDKAASAVTEHMKKIANALKKRNLDADMYRNDEVVRIIIPCADLFAPNDTVLKEGAKKLMQPVAQILKSPTMYKIVIAVYSDDTGDVEYCDNLTDIRANIIDDFLTSIAEVQEVNTVPYGMGRNSDRAPNNSIVNRALNRRAEIYIIPEWNMIKDARAGKL